MATAPDTLEDVRRAAQGFVRDHVVAAGVHRAAIGVVDDANLRLLAGFMDNAQRLPTALAAIAPAPAPVDLFGGLRDALEQLDNAVTASSTGVAAGALLLFSAGRDDAGRVGLDDVLATRARSSSAVVAVGVGAAPDVGVLTQLGGATVAVAEGGLDVEAANALVREELVRALRGHDVAGYCTPARSGDHTLSVAVGAGAPVGFDFNARGFTAGCTFNSLATQCGQRECGGVGGPRCGQCPDGERCSPPGVCFETCGDGQRAKTEACDDGDVLSGDGCDGSCGLEPGFACDEPGAACTAVCGDGLRRASEGCDD
ncbi:MAG: DUF4215 domain-containing protein [Deltaproteobacteria bacterium]|nr:DUF4215 domain-containing protein [Deltaproteobacteria bacterium]